VEVDHGGGNIRMAEEVLDGADIDTGFQEVGGERVSEGVAGGPLGQIGAPDRLSNLAGEGFFVEMKSREPTCSRVWAKVGGGKGPLPWPFAARVRIFCLKTFRHVNVALPGREILAVTITDHER